MFYDTRSCLKIHAMFYATRGIKTLVSVTQCSLSHALLAEANTWSSAEDVKASLQLLFSARLNAPHTSGCWSSVFRGLAH
jgi:hypothetical protein